MQKSSCRDERGTEEYNYCCTKQAAATAAAAVSIFTSVRLLLVEVVERDEKCALVEESYLALAARAINTTELPHVPFATGRRATS